MIIKALGVHGGVDTQMNTTSFIIDDVISIDAGSVASRLCVPDQLKIDHVFISHTHLDHIKDLAFLADTACDEKKNSIKVYSTKEVIKILKDHFFNDLIWPDFSKIPTVNNPVVEFVEVAPEEKVTIANKTIQLIPVHHPVPAVGFVISDEKSSVVISGDTGPTERIWEVAKSYAGNPKQPLRAIITEVSFPNRLQQVADLAGHFTPRTFQAEVTSKMPHGVPIYLFHLKPPHGDEVIQEVNSLQVADVEFLELDQVIDSSVHLKSLPLKKNSKSKPQAA